MDYGRFRQLRSHRIKRDRLYLKKKVKKGKILHNLFKPRYFTSFYRNRLNTFRFSFNQINDRIFKDREQTKTGLQEILFVKILKPTFFFQQRLSSTMRFLLLNNHDKALDKHLFIIATFEYIFIPFRCE